MISRGSWATWASDHPTVSRLPRAADGHAWRGNVSGSRPPRNDFRKHPPLHFFNSNFFFGTFAINDVLTRIWESMFKVTQGGIMFCKCFLTAIISRCSCRIHNWFLWLAVTIKKNVMIVWAVVQPQEVHFFVSYFQKHPHFNLLCCPNIVYLLQN